MPSQLRRIALIFGLLVQFSRGEALLQYFNTSWSEIANKMPELVEAGYTALWLPPPTKGSGGLSVGYDLWDPFDLGSKDQRNSVRTRYGTEADLLNLMEVAHRFGVRIYFDNIMNHRAFDVPGYNEDTPIDVYPGMVPEDFHLRRTEDGFYRKWDNTRDWSSSWEVQNLGLADLIDIAHETPNTNHGASMNDDHPKYSFIRDLERPEQYDKDKDGNVAYFGVLIDQAREELGTGATAEQLRLKAKEYINANRAPFVEDVGAYLIRAARWKMDRTKADGLRLDAVKHVPDYFFGQISGNNKDFSDAGYLGGVQWQFNRSRGFSDGNHRDSVFEDKRGRDDAMVFGEHLGQPPGYGGYWDSGMRLVDNDLRSKLNGVLASPWGTLAGLDSPGAGGFAPSLGVMHANSHDSDYAALKEWQHAFYMTRDGIGLVYTDGYYKAATLGESGGAFPRHANTNFLGQFADPRIPNILKIHNDFARGLQQGRWSDGDYLAFERRDNRDKFGNSRSGSASEEITMVAMYNDNTAQGQARGIISSFPSNAYLWQYAEGPNGSSQTGFYKYAGELNSVVVPPGGYFIFSWRTPELSTLWPAAAITLYQNGEEVPRITVTRKDGPDGDKSYNPYGISNRGYPVGSTPEDYSYRTSVPVVKGGSPLSIIARADGSAENIMLKLDGGVDLNGTRPVGITDPAFRDHPPGIFSDIWAGLEQPTYVDRQHPEKFAAKDTVRCQIGSPGAETFVKSIGGAYSVNNGPVATNNYNTENGNQASFLYHDGEDNVGGLSGTIPKQFDDSGDSIVIWTKSNSVGAGFKMFVYYTTDGSFPEGAGGIGRGTTKAAELSYRHNQGTENWWASASISKPTAGTNFIYKIGAYKIGASSWWPSGPTEVAYKKKMLTTFRVADFNPATIQHFPHNDYARVPTLGKTYNEWPFAMQTGLSEGFHVIRARAFLNRDVNTSAPIYQTFTQTFYYDAQTPQGAVAFPQNNGDTVGGSSYEIVVRTDATVQEVWYHIDDSEAGNNDTVTKQLNGNGAGFEPFTDANGNGIRDSAEEFIDVNGNGTYDTTLSDAWAKATEVTPSLAITSPYQKEWRFRYNNVPATGQATMKVRLLEASSSRNLTLDATTANVTEITRTLETRGPDERVNIAWPRSDGDRVDDNYTMKVYFTKALSQGISEQELKNRMTFFANGADQGRDGWTINYGNYGANDAFHELSIPLSNLYNDDPNFIHTLRVLYRFPDNYSEVAKRGLTLEAVRLVRANPSTKPFVRITQPSELGSDGKPTEIILPDVAGADSLRYTIRVETSATVTSLNLVGSPTISLIEEPFTDTNGNGVWDDQEASTDINKNDIWDVGESYVDLNSNGSFDAGENFFDLNNNGIRDPAEPFTDSNGNGIREGVTVTTNGNTKTWDYTWNITAAGNYLLTASASVNGQSTASTRNARVILRQVVESDGNESNDDDNDGLIDITETNKKDLPETQSETWSNGDVHVWYASGRTLPTSPDSDGDGLPDALEVGWRVAASPPTDPNADTNGDGRKNFIGDMDPPLYAVVEHAGYVPGVGSQSAGDDRTRQAAGSVTDPTKADTDGDGLNDGIEDKNANGWTDGDGKSLPLTAGRNAYATARPNAGDWPNNFMDNFETWTETSPTLADSDGDALQDGFGEDKNFNGFIDGDTNNNRVHDSGEQWSETDPLNADSDGDGLPDGWEDQYGLDPLDDGAFSKRSDSAGNPNNGASGDPDNDGFTNAQELASGTHPTQPDIIGGTAGEGSIRIGTFTDWNHGDLLSLDEYNEGGSQGADVYRTNGNDSSRDIVAFSFRDGGDVSAGGDGRVYFRVDFMDLAVNAWQGEVDSYIVIDTGNPATGERSMPNEVDIATDMKWEVVVATYGQNFGSIFVDRNLATNTTTQFQNPVTEGGVEARGFGGQNEAAWSSRFDAVEIAIERRHLKDAGWLGDPNTLNFQVFTTMPNTNGSGSGDISGRNDIRDSIADDWLASDYWKDQDNIRLNGKLSGYFGRSTNNDRNKSAKVMLLAHGNQAIQPSSVTQSLIRSGSPAVGYSRLVQTHESYNAPLTLHLTPTLASALQWAKNPSAGSWPNNDGPTFNTRLRNLVSSGRVSLVGSSFSDHVPRYFPQDFNNSNKSLSEQFLDTIYGTNAASRLVFWPSERVLDTTTLQTIDGMGYDFTFADQMRHFLKWFGRSSALGTPGYRINEVNGVKLFPIHDVTSEYLDQTLDEGSSLAVRQLLSRRSRSGVQDQVVTLWRDMGDFANNTKANSYDSNVRWLSSRPWIRVVTAQQIATGQVSYKGQDSNTYNTWGTVTQGNATTTRIVSKDWVDHASGETYDNWYHGGNNRPGLKNQSFGASSVFGQVGESGHANTVWDSVKLVDTGAANLRRVAETVIHGAMFQTAFHNSTNADLSKYSTGDYISVDNGVGQTLADFARNTQSQTRFANIYGRVQQWNASASTSTLAAEAIDVDLDGASEYLLYNSRVFAVFEGKGGRMTAAWLRNPDTGLVWQVAGNLGSYSGTDSENEGESNFVGSSTTVNAYRTSGFKDWWTVAGASGTNSGVNGDYTVSAANGSTGWTFSRNGISKTISLPNSWAGRLNAAYSLGSNSKLFVRFGLSPNLLDLMLNGHSNLGNEFTADVSGSRRLDLVNNNGTDTIRAFVVAPQINDAASDVTGSGFTTVNRRNQAQTHQVEVELTGAGPHLLTLGFDQGVDDQAPNLSTDGIPNSWWDDYFTNTADYVGSADPDGDGMTNSIEWLVGLNPIVNDINSYPKLSITKSGTNYKLSIPTIANRRYQLQVSSDMSSWTNSGQPTDTAVGASAGLLEITDTPVGSKRFYRMLISTVP